MAATPHPPGLQQGEPSMSKFLITAAAITAFFAAAGSASAMPGTANNIAIDSPVTQVGLCFYFDGWNGPGFYECGYRHRRGHGWHGKTRAGYHGHHGGKSHHPSGKSYHSGKSYSGKHSGKKKH
jgi:hypothetical protein